ncbi:hypothetical protein HMPREF1549_02877, partial [Actinomyces johnsonii F0510]
SQHPSSQSTTQRCDSSSPTSSQDDRRCTSPFSRMTLRPYFHVSYFTDK